MIRRHAMSLIEDDTMARSVRWEMITLLVFAPCTNPHELIFGMDDASAAAIAEAAASLVRSPSEAELYRVAVENVERVGRGGFEVSGLFAPVRAISRLLGNPRLTACLSISFASSM